MKYLTQKPVRNVALAALAIVTVTLGFNCSRYVVMDSKQNELASIEPDPSTNNSGGPRIDSTKPQFALLMADQIFRGMLSTTGIATPSAAVLTAYNARKTSLADVSTLSSANGPMMVALTNLAGEVCLQAVTEEKALTAAQRQLFIGVDFNLGPASINDAGLTSTIGALGRSILGREPAAQEVTDLKAYANGFVASLSAANRTARAQTDLLTVSMCAAVLSSLDAWSY